MKSRYCFSRSRACVYMATRERVKHTVVVAWQDNGVDFPLTSHLVATRHRCLTTLPNRSPFSFFCVENQAGGKDLFFYLLEPVQRFPRYALLVGDLLRRTEEGHPDHGDLSRALDKV